MKAYQRRFLLVAAAWLLAAPLAQAAPRAPVRAAAPAPLSRVTPQDMTMGSPRAPVTVIEYASAACPHCARFNNDVFPAFKKKYVDTGKVRYVYREYLTSPVEVAAAGALLARCAGRDKYFSVLDDFFHGQANAYETGDVRSLIISVGEKAGLTGAQISACIGDQAAADALNKRVERYAAGGVEGTPTFVINGRKMPDLDHEVQLADLDAAIRPLLRPRRRR